MLLVPIKRKMTVHIFFVFDRTILESHFSPSLFLPSTNQISLHLGRKELCFLTLDNLWGIAPSLKLQVSKHLCGPTLDHSLTYVVYKPLGSQLVLLLWVYFLCHLASIFNPKYLTPLHFTVHCNMFVRWSNDTQHQVLDETFKLFFDHGL